MAIIRVAVGRQRRKPESDQALTGPCSRREYEIAEAFVEKESWKQHFPGAPVSPILPESASEKAFVIPATDDRLQPN